MKATLVASLTKSRAKVNVYKNKQKSLAIISGASAPGSRGAAYVDTAAWVAGS